MDWGTLNLALSSAEATVGLDPLPRAPTAPVTRSSDKHDKIFSCADDIGLVAWDYGVMTPIAHVFKEAERVAFLKL